jgi:hypothetical protein
MCFKKETKKKKREKKMAKGYGARHAITPSLLFVPPLM